MFERLIHDLKSTDRKKRWIRRLILVLVILCVLGLLAYHFLFAPPSVINIPDGFTSAKEYLNMIGFQDASDYCIYRYDSVDPVASDSLYTKMTQEDVQTVRGYFENAREWPAMEENQQKNPFDENCISAGDYYIIYTRAGENDGYYTFGEYDNYSVWFFDVETCTLYYIHNDN